MESLSTKLREFMSHCERCFFPHTSCLCLKESEKVKLPFRLIFILNKSEFFKLSNSARIFLMNSYPCEFRLRGLQNTPLNYESFAQELEGEKNYLLYPLPDAKPLSLTEAISQAGNKRVNLIVPDGNWSQGAKIANKINQQKNIEAVSLSAPPKSSYLLRKNPNEERISTFEASYFALKELLNSNEQKILTQSFEKFVKEILKLRGKIPRT